MSMSLAYRSVGLAVKDLHLRTLKRIHIQFDPFHPAVSSIRDFMFIINNEKLRLTNPMCSVKNEIVCDLSPPQVDLTLNDGKKYRLLAEHLTLLELVQQLSGICTKHDMKSSAEKSKN